MNDLSRVRCFDPKLHVGQSLQVFGLVTAVLFDVSSPSSAITVTSSLLEGLGFKPHIGSGFGTLRRLRSDTHPCDADLPTQQLFKAAAIAKRGKSVRHTLPTSTATTQSRVAKRKILRARVIMVYEYSEVSKRVRENSSNCQRRKVCHLDEVSTTSRSGWVRSLPCRLILTAH